MVEAAQMAARLTDPVGHSLGMLGMLAGALLGAAVGALMIVALPVSAPLLVGALVGAAAVGAFAGGALAGDQLMNGIQEAFSIPDPTTGMIGMVGSPNVLIGMLPAARAVVDMAAECNGLFCVNHMPMPPFGPPPPIADGAATVLINNMPAARVTSKLVCGAEITKGCETVKIGGATVRMLEVHDNEEIMKQFFGTLLEASVIAAGVITFFMGGEAFVGFALTLGGFSIVNDLAGDLGDAIGPGWRDILQGGVGLVAVVAGGKKGAEAEGRLPGEEPPVTEKPPTKDCPTQGEPVNAVTGEMVTWATDFELPGALPIVFERAYSSSMGEQSWLGPNWACTFGQSVRPDGALAFQYLSGDGGIVQFRLSTLDEEGWMRHPSSSRLRLRQTASGFQLVNPKNQLITFAQARGKEWLITEIRDLNGNALSFHYRGGILHTVQHTGGYRLHITGTPTHITGIYLEQFDESLATLVRYDYDEYGRLTGIDNGSGVFFRYEYDSFHRLVNWTDRNGHSYAYRYGDDGRVAESVGDSGLYHYLYRHDHTQRISVAIDSYGGTKTFHYDEKGQVVAEYDEVGGITTTEWDDYGRRISIKDAEGRGVSYEYDNDGNLTRSTDRLGRTTQMEYNVLGLPVLLIDNAGQRWVRSYDQRGNLLEAGLEGGTLWSYPRDNHGNVISVVDPEGRFREFGYNGSGLPMFVTDWQGNRTRYMRDSFGRVIYQQDPLDAETHYAYNTIHKLAQITLPTGAQIHRAYDPEGNVISRTAQDGSTYVFSYGAFGMRTSVTRPSGSTLLFHYDELTRLIALENEKSERWTYTLDLAGRVIEEEDFSGRKQSYQYDRSGDCIRHSNHCGETIYFERNKAGQVVKTQTQDGDEANFSYDKNGFLVEATNQWTSLKFERDENGRILREVQGEYIVESQYDERGHRTVRRTGEEETKWSYDSNGRLERIGLPDDSWLEFEYDSKGRNRERRFRGKQEGLVGVSLRQEFDSLDRLVSQWAGLEAGASREAVALAERQYRYGSNECPAEVADRSFGTDLYQYTQDGRIQIAERERGASEAFQYDVSGNISAVLSDRIQPDQQVSLGKDLKLESRLIGRGGRLERAGETAYAYDEEGRVVQKRVSCMNAEDRVWTFNWTSRGQLRSVHNPEGERWFYEYDAIGRRTKKTGPDSSTLYIWDGRTIAEEICQNANSISKQSWVYESGSFRPLASFQQGQAFACVLDRVGTPTMLVSANGKNAWSAQLDTWGNITSQTADEVDCPIRFQGQWKDSESGLHYNHWRYYDPETGVYLSPDPIGLDGGTRSYGYVPNPLIDIDPLGLAPQKGDPLPDDTQINRIGGSDPDNLALKPGERGLDPPGFSTLQGDDPQAAADQMRSAFPKATGLQKASETTGTASAKDIRDAGFDVIHDPTNKFDNHARVVHPDGADGFDDPQNRANLSKAFKDSNTAPKDGGCG